MEAQSKQAREREPVAFVDITRATIVTENVSSTVREMFIYHAWDEEQRIHGEKVRNALMDVVLSIIENVPPCPTRSVAIRKIIEARMDCNNAITSGGRY